MFFFFFKQKTAYEMRISDWSSDVCSSDLEQLAALAPSSALRAPSPASGRRAVWTMSAGGRTASRAAARPTGILTQPLNAPEESPPDGSLVHGGRPVPAGHHPDGPAHFPARHGRAPAPTANRNSDWSGK